MCTLSEVHGAPLVTGLYARILACAACMYVGAFCLGTVSSVMVHGSCEPRDGAHAGVVRMRSCALSSLWHVGPCRWHILQRECLRYPLAGPPAQSAAAHAPCTTNSGAHACGHLADSTTRGAALCHPLPFGFRRASAAKRALALGAARSLSVSRHPYPLPSLGSMGRSGRAR